MGWLTEVAGYPSNFDPDGNVRLFLASTRDSQQWPSSTPWLSKYTAGVCRGCGSVYVFACTSVSVYESLSERERETIGALPTQAS